MTAKLRSKLISLWQASNQQATRASEQSKGQPPAHQKMSGGYQKAHTRKIRKKKNH